MQHIRNYRYKLSALGIGLLLLILNLLYIPESDDMYFTVWRFRNFTDRLLTRPIQDKPYIIGIMHNGRILGNFLGVLQSVLMTTEFWWVRALLFSAGILCMGYLITGIFFKNSEAGKNWMVVTFFLVCANRGIYANVYSWGVAYVNYVIPLIGFCLVYYILENRKDDQPAIAMILFLIASASQLFMETFTMSMCVFAVFLLFRSSYTRRYRIDACLGYLLGAVLMLINPEYRQVAAGDAVYTVGVSMEHLLKNCSSIAYQGYIQNVLLILLIDLGLAKQSMKAGKIDQRWMRGIAGLSVCMEIFPLICHLCGTFTRSSALGCMIVMVVCWLIKIWSLTDRRLQYTLLQNLMIGAVSVGPLIMVHNSLSDRMFMECYVMLIFLAIPLMDEWVLRYRKISLLCYFISILTLTGLIGVYYRNYSVDQMRLASGREAIEKGENHIILPLVPYPSFVSNENPRKTDTSFLLYREEPYDVELEFIAYDEYMNMIDK